jgi:hypothetical protein
MPDDDAAGRVYDEVVEVEVLKAMQHHAAPFADATTFISSQSYGNFLAQSKQTTYVVESAPGVLAVIGNVQWR